MIKIPPGDRRFAPGWSLTGVVVGSVGYVASLTPTLLPRTSATQALASSVLAITGYGVGTIAETIVRTAAAGLRKRRGLPASGKRLSTPLRAGITLGVVVVAAAFTPVSVGWQEEQRALTQVPGSAPTTPLVVALTAAASLVLLYAGRAIRALTRKIGASFSARGWGIAAADGTAVAIVVIGFAVLGGAGYGISLIVFDKMNGADPVGYSRPMSPTRSGSPASPVTWQSLGVQGRKFVAGGPTPEQIQAVTGRPALDPIRAYAGIETNGEARARAREAVQDLVRAGGLERERIVVYTPSTNGYVDSIAAAAAEFVAGGDIASVSMQYTVLPSAMSMIFNTAQSIDAGTLLLRETQEAIARLPSNKRPRIYVYGESLGAYGSLGPFDGVGVEGFASLVDGAVWAGPPANSAYWEQMNEAASGGPAWQPIVADGSVIRFAADAAGLAQPDAPWGPARGVFLQNATDPVVWWSPDLILHRPAWLDNPRGPNVPDKMTWLPFVTFWQVFVDMPPAGGMPPGLGHNYEPWIGPTWVAVMQPEGWGPPQDERLQSALSLVKP